MATVRVIAYTLHEHEHMAAGQALRNPIEGESYTIGEIDDSQIDGLRSQGLIVEPLDRDTAPSVGRPIFEWGAKDALEDRSRRRGTVSPLSAAG